MRRVDRKGKPARAKMGSLLDDVGEIAQRVYAALADDDVVVWTSSGLEVFFMHAHDSPEVPAEHVIGTYRLGASAADIEEDLLELRKSRVSGAMLY